MKHLNNLLMSLLVLFSPLSAATLKDECYEARTKIIGCLEIYDRISARNEENKKQSQHILEQGDRPITLLREIARDDSYLKSVEPIVSQLMNIKSTLDSIACNRVSLHERVIKELVLKARALDSEHKIVFEQTLMTISGK